MTDTTVTDQAIDEAHTVVKTLEEWLASVGLYEQAWNAQKVRYGLIRWRNRIARDDA